jgi:hypothetical protein
MSPSFPQKEKRCHLHTKSLSISVYVNVIIIRNNTCLVSNHCVWLLYTPSLGLIRTWSCHVRVSLEALVQHVSLKKEGSV